MFSAKHLRARIPRRADLTTSWTWAGLDGGSYSGLVRQCQNDASPWMVKTDRTCENYDWTYTSKKRCNTSSAAAAKWLHAHYCADSCFQHGQGYAGQDCARFFKPATFDLAPGLHELHLRLAPGKVALRSVRIVGGD